MATQNLKLGKPFTIKKPYNAGTGYTWDILLSPSLVLIDKSYNIINEKPGGTNEVIWTINSLEVGTAYILLWNHRPWEAPDISKAKLSTVNIVK